MRSLISLSVAVLLTLGTVSTSRAAGQLRKSKAKARVQHRASRGKAMTSATPAAVPAPVAIATLETQADGVRRIAPAEARTAVAQGKAIIIDVRGEDSYNAGHIKGARWINLNDIGSRAGELPRDKMIITYCS
jgi:predicted sulfurtransferase